MSWMNRFRNLFRLGRLNDELREELQFHIEARIADNLDAGMQPEDARRDAVQRFGGELLARDRSRDANIIVWLANLGQDLRYGLRTLWKNPGVTSVALFSLALGIAANTAIFSVVNAVLLRPLPYKNADRLAILFGANSVRSSELNVSLLNFEDWKKQNRSFEEMAIFRESGGPLLDPAAPENDPEWVTSGWVSGNFFELLGRSPVLGRLFTAGEFEQGERVAVLSHRLWQQRFGGSADVLGRVLRISGLDLRVIGVMSSDFQFPSGEVMLWFPERANPEWRVRRTDRGTRFGAVVGRLKPNVTIEQARADIAAIVTAIQQHYPMPNADVGVKIVPLRLRVQGTTVPFLLFVLSGAVAFVLLIACTNVANLLLARGAVRSREIALRIALGAGRGRVMRQLLTESVLLACAAGGLSLPLTAWGVEVLVGLAPGRIARLDQVHIDGDVLLFTIFVSVVCGLLFGLAPALKLSSSGAGMPLLGSARVTGGGMDARRTRGALVICEFALAVVLLTGSGLLIRSFIAVQGVDPGFKAGNVLVGELRFQASGASRTRLYREAIDRIARLPGVRAAGAIGTMFWAPSSDARFGLRAVEDRPDEDRDRWEPLSWTTISGDYFQALGIPLLKGRYFTRTDHTGSPPVAIVNETMARRFWPNQDPIGKRFKGFDARGRNDDWVTVVGLVRDVYSRGRDANPMAQIFETQDQADNTTEKLVISFVSDEKQIGASIRSAIRSIDNSAVLRNLSTLAAVLEEQTSERRFQTYVLSLFAFVAFVLAGAGIFGVMHYSVVQRTQEMGIRIALGAGTSDVITMVIREALTLVLIGVAMGLAGSLVLMRWMSSLLFGVAPSDPLTLTVVSMLLTGIAMMACYLPARRATRIDPMLALRSE